MTTSGQQQVAVVGASGILAPLGALLRTPGRRTLGISRGSRLQAGDWDDRVTLDAHDLDAVRAWRRQVAPDVLVAYSPAVGDDVWPHLCAGVPRSVVVATSRWSAPGAPGPPWAAVGGLVLVRLGWTRTADGARWHTPAEVSDVVARAVTGDETEWVVGEVVPWSERPS